MIEEIAGARGPRKGFFMREGFRAYQNKLCDAHILHRSSHSTNVSGVGRFHKHHAKPLKRRI